MSRLLSAKIGQFLQFFSKSQRKHFIVYLLGLILMMKFRSIKAISKEYSKNDPSVLNHFITDSPWDEKALTVECQKIIYTEERRQKTFLIIDDTPIERNGKEIEGIGVHHGAKGLVRGHCCVTSSIVSGKDKFIWDIREYVPKCASIVGEFKSKVKIACDIISDAELPESKITVMFDSWYTNKKVIEAVNNRKWRYIAGVKRNRKIYIDGRLSRVSHLAKGGRKYIAVVCGKNKFKVSARTANIPAIGRVVIYIVKSKRMGTRYLVSNDLHLSPEEAVKAYANRFWIETEHREMKQYFGLNELFLRKFRGVQRHCALVGCAYNIVQFIKRDAARHKRATTGEIIRMLQKELRNKDVRKYCERILFEFYRKAS